MPPKKRAGTDSNSRENSVPESAAPSKRQRVSLACDACRVARERCDGARSSCGTCVAQNRTCSYTPAAKKRGVQTGYLRTIELSLEWIFEQYPDSEEAFYQLLTKNGGVDGARLLQKKDKPGNRLHKKWTKSRIHKEIGRLLSDSPSLPVDMDTSAEDSDTSEGGVGQSDIGNSLSPSIQVNAQQNIRQSSQNIQQNKQQNTPTNAQVNTPSDVQYNPPPNTRLPANWRRLVDIYFAYTHCWLPILDKITIINTALLFPTDGIATRMIELPPSYAELWAVLSLAAFQDASSSTPTNDMSPKKIYAIARDMMPSEERRFELPHLRALLLHSLVLVGQGAGLAAWMLVGTAVRLALHLRGTGELYAGDVYEEPLKSSGALAFAACLVLNTFTSACLGQPTFLKVDIKDILTSVDAMSGLAENESWMPILSVGSPNDGGGPITTQPLKTFYQLYKFSQILSASLDAESLGSYASQVVSPEDLVKCLDPQFSFCSSVLYGGSTPLVPSAFLLQAAFLAATIHLIPGYRASLLSSLMEMVESCISNFGACGTPPVVVGLIGMVRRCGHLDKMHDVERSRWESTMESLTSVWKQQFPSHGFLNSYSTTYSTAGRSNVEMPSPGIFNLGYDGGQGVMHTSSGSGYTLPRVDDTSHSQRVFPMHPPVRSPVNPRNIPSASPGISFLSSGIMRGSGTGTSAMYNGGSANQPVDYDAILEELGSIDCTDRLDTDPQFMTNLGFTPGADLGDMFHGDYGV